MNLDYSPEQQRFAAELRDFLAKELPQEISDKVRRGEDIAKEDYETWHRLLHRRGWLAGPWPKAYGGQGWGAVMSHVFEEECAHAFAPRVVPFGVKMLGPVLIKFGSDAQQKTYLPRILDGRDWWCQGYSEPGAGSDLASLKTRAVRDGDRYIVNGQKTWTTLGQYANRIFCLVRTKADGKPQDGISFLLVDLDTPGIEMRPIRLIEGGHEVNEVFFTDVPVPAENLVGAENVGWTIAKFLLSHERSAIAGTGQSFAALAQLKALGHKIRRNGKRLIEDPLFACKLAELEIELEALRVTNLRMLSGADAGVAPGPEVSMLKIKGTVIRQGLNDLARQALGPAAAPFPADALDGNLSLVPDGHALNAATYFNNRKMSIYGGSNEIQRNILAKGLMGA